MKIFPLLENKWKNATHPFLIHNKKKIYFNDIKNRKIDYLGLINPGDIVIVIGDYNELSISLLFHLIESKAIIVPLTKKTNSEEEIEYLKNTIPIKRLAEPIEIARLVLFISSEVNTYLTGQNIIIDGGYTNI